MVEKESLGRDMERCLIRIIKAVSVEVLIVE